MDEVLVLPAVHCGGVRRVRVAQLLLVGVLQVLRIQAALGVEVSHQAGSAGSRQALRQEVVPNPFLIGAHRAQSFLSRHRSSLWCR